VLRRPLPQVDVERLLLRAAMVQSRNQLAFITRSVNSLLLKQGIGAVCQLRWMAAPRAAQTGPAAGAPPLPLAPPAK
jgi:hypothetical protein